MPRKRKKTTPAPTNDDIALARSEAAELLGLDPDRLSPGDRLRCELVAALRCAVDDELGKVTSARAPDLARLIVAVEALTKFLAEAKPDPHRLDEGDDPHGRLMRIIDNWIANHEAEKVERVAAGEPADELEAAQMRVAELETEVARLRGLPAPEGERVIDPPTADVVPPGEQPGGRNLRTGPQVGIDDHKVGPKPVIDGKVNPPTPLQVWAAECERIEQLRKQYAPQAEPWQPAKPNCPAVAKPGWLTRIERDLANSRRALDHQIMTAPSRVSGEPQPSNGTESWRFPQAAFRREW